MKKTILYIGCIILCILLTGAGYAQTQPTTTDIKVYQTSPRSINDPNLSNKLQSDLSSRDARVKLPATWYDSGYGYYGVYSVDATNYMARYDNNGNYIETLTQKKWDNAVPSNVRTSFSQSPFSSDKVTGYWEVSSPGRTGYYVETFDRKGRTSRIWLDENGMYNYIPNQSVK